MARWIRRTDPGPLVNLQIHRPGDDGGHQCSPPRSVDDAGPRSIWQCDCGRKWRIAAPYWRPVETATGRSGGSVPAWVTALNDIDPDT